jgi:hypothetical protein
MAAREGLHCGAVTYALPKEAPRRASDCTCGKRARAAGRRCEKTSSKPASSMSSSTTLGLGGEWGSEGVAAEWSRRVNVRERVRVRESRWETRGLLLIACVSEWVCEWVSEWRSEDEEVKKWVSEWRSEEVKAEVDKKKKKSAVWTHKMRLRFSRFSTTSMSEWVSEWVCGWV